MTSIVPVATDTTVFKQKSVVRRFPRLLVPAWVRTNGFICGCGHSGTTLIATILSAHPKVYVPLRETYIFLPETRMPRWRHFRILWKAGLLGKRALVEKSPRHVHHLDAIRRDVDGARFIMPVRDGRDTVASLFRRRNELGWAIKRWIDETSIVLAERGKPDVFVYRHEDLVRSPEKIVKQICQFLDLDYREDLLLYYRKRRMWFRQRDVRAGSGQEGEEHDALRNWQVNQPIFDSSGRWRQYLTEEDLLEITQGSGRKLMEAFGYL